MRSVIAVAGLVASTYACADQSAVLFEIVLTRGGTVVASPKVVAEFGKTVALAEGHMKFEGSASTPDKDGNSFTAVKLSLIDGRELKAIKQMSMLADLTKSPSFEVSVPGTDARFVVKPRLVKVPG